MQQAIYTNVAVSTHALSGHGSEVTNNTSHGEPQIRRFEKLRMVFSVAGNVLGGALLLSGMLMLPQLFVSLLAG